MHCDSNTLAPLLIGGGVAIFAFALATARDTLVRRRDSENRRALSLGAFVAEMEANRVAIQNDLTLVGIERQDLDSGTTKGMLNPLSRLESGAWSAATIDLPTALLEDEDLVQRLRVIARNTTDINGLIQSREAFRIQHLSRDDLIVEGLRKYGDVLTHMLQDLGQRIDEAKRELQPHLT